MAGPEDRALKALDLDLGALLENAYLVQSDQSGFGCGTVRSGPGLRV